MVKHPLPEEFRKYFWETDPDKMDWVESGKNVMEKIIQFGDVADWQKLINMYGLAKLTEVVKTSKRISFKTANFFGLIWNIPTGEITCLKPEFRQTQRQHWDW